MLGGWDAVVYDLDVGACGVVCWYGAASGGGVGVGGGCDDFGFAGLGGYGDGFAYCWWDVCGVSGVWVVGVYCGGSGG